MDDNFNANYVKHISICSLRYFTMLIHPSTVHKNTKIYNNKTPTKAVNEQSPQDTANSSLCCSRAVKSRYSRKSGVVLFSPISHEQ